MKRLIIVFLTLLLTLGVNGIKGQNIDSLLGVWNKQSSSTDEKLGAINKVAYLYLNIDADSSIYYANMSLAFARKNKQLEHEASTLNTLAIGYMYKGDFPKAMALQAKHLAITREIKDYVQGAKTISNMGLIYERMSNFPQALNMYFSAIRLYDDELRKCDTAIDKAKIEKLKMYQDMTYGNMGLIYDRQGKYEKSIEYHSRSLKIAKEIDDRIGIAAALGNMGLIYEAQKRYALALSNQKEALEIRRAENYTQGIIQSLGSIGSINIALGKYDEALKYLIECRDLAKELGDQQIYGISIGEIGSIYLQKKEYDRALPLINEALKIASSIGDLNYVIHYQENLYSVYKVKNNAAMALKHHEQYALLKDSVFKDENREKILQRELEYESDKQQKELLLEQEKKDLLNNEKRKQQNIILTGIVLVLISVLVFSVMLYRRFKITREQKSIIEEKNQEITDSINYAKKIQHALLPSETFVNNLLPNHFILFAPKAIVSGDFYWCSASPSNANMVYFAAADCTGHGVPGGFMSMLGMTFLNDAVNEKHLVHTHEILDASRESIKNALNKGQTDGNTKHKDGMDISLVRLNKATNTIQVSAANNNLYIIRNAEELIEIKADKQPVGMYEMERPFSVHELSVQKGDIIYSFSDGFVDQFGGPDGKKYMHKNFKKFLLGISSSSLGEQKKLLTDELQRWKSFEKHNGGSFAQIDDVTIFAVKV